MRKRVRHDDIAALENEHDRLCMTFPVQRQHKFLVTFALQKGLGLKLTRGGTRELSVVRRLFQIETDLFEKQVEHNLVVSAIAIEILCDRKFNPNSVFRNVAVPLVYEMVYAYVVSNRVDLTPSSFKVFEKLLK